MPPSRRNDLVDAAMRVFYRHGFNNTSLDQVLDEGGISRMTLYNHFKSKDELIVAALRLQDERSEQELMNYLQKIDGGPIERIMGIFDFCREWFLDDEFCGCMFINASAEFDDPACVVRCVSAEHKRTMVNLMRKQCEQAGLRDPHVLAEKLCILLDGAVVTAHVVGKVDNNETRLEEAAEWAKDAARVLIDASKVA
ncbi:TetR/AcrR family transcriptional regulator [Planctomycetota bacterium]|nr:TetR/AcrR family transcriptional regulator [Planctomycetota bacterium]